jgi:hypothetical protein
MFWALRRHSHSKSRSARLIAASISCPASRAYCRARAIVVPDKIFGPPETLPFGRYDDLDVNVYVYFPNG